VSDEKDKKFENEDEVEDVEAHQKIHHPASSEPKEDDDSDDVEAHFKGHNA